MENCLNSIKDHIKTIFDPLSAHIIIDYLTIVNSYKQKHYDFFFKLLIGTISLFYNGHSYEPLIIFDISPNIGHHIVYTEDDYSGGISEQKLFISIYELERFYNRFLIDKKYFSEYKRFKTIYKLEHLYKKFSIDGNHYTTHKKFKKQSDLKIFVPVTTMKINEKVQPYISDDALVFLHHDVQQDDYGDSIQSYLIFNNKDTLMQFLDDYKYVMYMIKHFLLHELMDENVNDLFNEDYVKKNKYAVINHSIDDLILPIKNDLKNKTNLWINKN
jgi:hypothetical protein